MGEGKKEAGVVPASEAEGLELLAEEFARASEWAVKAAEVLVKAGLQPTSKVAFIGMLHVAAGSARVCAGMGPEEFGKAAAVVAEVFAKVGAMAAGDPKVVAMAEEKAREMLGRMGMPVAGKERVH